MDQKKRIRFLSAALALVMTLTTVAPTTAYAANEGEAEGEAITEETVDNSTEDGTTEGTEEGTVEGAEDSADETTEEETESAEESTTEGTEEESTTEEEEAEALAEELTVSDYDTFLASLKTLESYASTYAREHAGEDEIELVINYIRTGVEKYTDGSWNTLAGNENKEFTSYVAAQDAANGTQVAALKNIEEFTVPNGDTVEFGHMFGCMNITYYMAKTNPSAAAIYADMSGWGGDLCDLMAYTKDQVSGDDVEAMATEIRENYLGVDDPSINSFGILDIYGDLDAYYIINSLGGGKTISTVMANYFNKNLTDEGRALYFVKNRFPGNGTQSEIREAVYNAYSTNSMIKNLEASEGITSDMVSLRKACSYAFADYLFNLTGEITSETKNDYYSVFNTISSTLAPGVSQEIKYAYTADDKQIIYYLATADVTRDDLTIYANYNNNDGSVWGMSRVTDQMKAAIKKHTDPDSEYYVPNYTPVVGVNADFFNMTTGEPAGALVMEGVKYHSANSKAFFAMLKDGTPVLGDGSDWAKYEDQVQEAVGGSTWLVKDGKLAVSATSDYYTSRASRTCIGITADNKVVLMVLDGRQEPLSAGGSAIEIAQIMLDAGCVTALNLDGGGSTTYVAKEEGSDELSIVNNPSDGFERSVSSSLMVVSTAKPSTEFDHALVTADSDYMTVGTSVNVEATGVSASGGSADLPEGSYLKVTDETVGTLKDGVFTAKATGDVDIQLVSGETVLGKKTLHVVVPDKIEFTSDNLNAIYGIAVDLPVKATYNGSAVAVNTNDIMFGFVDENMNVTLTSDAGTFDGFTFTGNEASGIRSVRVGAVLLENGQPNMNKVALITVKLFKTDEAMFDFDNATSGERQFAWNREVSNANTTDDMTYYIADQEKDMDVSYTFALDMTEIPIPENLLPLVSLLPGGDSADATAWGFLLQLAERVSVLTNVEVKMEVDPNFDIDYSELTVVNEYFELKSKEFDEETNTLTIKFNWIDQTQAIDPNTANSLCILSGIKLTPKEGTDEVLEPVMKGSVAYDIYLRASAVYSLAQDKAIQEQYGIYPFINPDLESEKGGHFSNTFVSFNDKFTLDRTAKSGWVKDANGNLSYYENNVPLTGIHELPEYLNEENRVFYDLGEDGISKGKINGLFQMDGKTYYAIAGKLKTGWHTIVNGAEKAYYYFNPETFEAADGEQTIDGFTYTFEDCILIRGQLVKDDNGTRYRWAGEWATQEWLNIDGNISYALQNGYFQTGLIHTFDINGNWAYIVFDENGVWLQNQNGLYDYEGKTYLTKDGYVVEYPGLVKVDGYYYYFNYSESIAIKNRDYWITKTNGIMPEGSYHFDEEGRMTNPVSNPNDPDAPETPEVPEQPEIPEEPTVKNGIVAENGSLFYYVDDVLTYAGLIEIDGSYYYVRTSGELVYGRDYWISKTNGLMPEKSYNFDADGKMTNPLVIPESPDGEVKNGIVAENGSLYYYVDGNLTYAGLIQIGDAFYYVKTSGEVINNRDYWITKTNGIMPEKSYNFDKDGKMTNPAVEPSVPEQPETPDTPEEPTVKNGIVAENGSLFYYVDNVLTYAGLIEIDGSYYYVRTSGELVYGRDYWITKTNGLMPEKSYNFDADGKITNPLVIPESPDGEVKNGIVSENGSLYYYVDGVLTYSGLIKIDGNYYYVRTSGEVVHGCNYWISKTNGLLPEKSYTFDSTGKIVF